MKYFAYFVVSLASLLLGHGLTVGNAEFIITGSVTTIMYLLIGIFCTYQEDKTKREILEIWKR